jgi:hypothetical protein
MNTKIIGIGALVILLSALAAAQTQPVERPSFVSPSGFPPMTRPPAVGPATMTVRLFVPTVEATDKALLPIIVEVNNGTDENVTVIDNTFLEFTFDKPVPVPNGLNRAPPADSDSVAIVLHMGVHLENGVGVGPSNARYKFFANNPRVSTTRPQAGWTIAPRTTLLGRLDLTAGQILPGVNTMQVTLVRHGKVIADGGTIEVRRIMNAVSIPSVGRGGVRSAATEP